MGNDELLSYEEKNNSLNFSIPQRHLNDEFQHCFKYYAMETKKSSNKELRITIQCKLGYHNKGNSDDCRNGTIVIEDDTVCNYIENNSGSILNFDLEGKLDYDLKEQLNLRKMYILNVMCIMETKKGPYKDWTVNNNKHWKKYLFFQQFEIDLPSIQEGTSTYVSISVICILLLVFSSTICIRRCQKTKTDGNKTPEGNSKSGNTSTDDQLVNGSFEMPESDIEDQQPSTDDRLVNRSFEIPESDIEDQQLITIINNQNTIAFNDCPDCAILSTLPKPIIELKDILYPRCTVDMEEKLGYGNYGSVLKGYLRMGKAR